MKNTLLNLPIYYMTVFTIPIYVAKQLESMQNRFLWEDVDGKKTYHLVSWKEVKDPIRSLGLGLRSLTTMNKDLHDKWIWSYLNEDNSLWKKIIDIKLMRKDCNGKLTLANRPHGLSLWRGIMAIYNRVFECTRWEVGNSTKVSFWQDTWCGEVNLMSRFPKIFAIARDKHILLGEAFSVPDHRVYTVSVSRHLNDWEVEEFESLLSLMSTVQLSDNRDRLCWTLRKNKSFSVSSLYRNLNTCRAAGNDCFHIKSYGRLLPSKGFVFRLGSVQGAHINY